jgi:hypothetical protein
MNYSYGAVTSIAIDPSNTSILYAGGETGGGTATVKSTDGGASWTTLLQDFSPYSLYGQVSLDAAMPSRLFVAGTDGVHRSTDGGATWSLSGPSSDSVVVDPVDGSKLFAGGYTGLSQSSDGGVTWAPIITGSQVNALAIDPGASQTLYFDSTQSGAVGHTGLYQRLSDGTLTETSLPASDVRAVALQPGNPLSVLAGRTSEGLTQSTDGGDSWLPTPLDQAIGSIAFDSLVPNTVYAADAVDGSLYKSTDGGQSWSTLTTPLQVVTVAVDPQSSAVVYAGGTDPGTYKAAFALSTDGGASWSETVFGDGVLSLLVVDPNSSSTLYAVIDIAGTGILKSTDGGLTWLATGNGLADVGVRSLAIDPVTSTTLYAGVFDLEQSGRVVFKSYDGGLSWSVSSNGINSPYECESVVVDPVNPATVYASCNGAGVFRSTDAGSSWGPFDDGMRIPFINSLAIDSTGKSLYAATFGGGVFAYYVCPSAAITVSPSVCSGSTGNPASVPDGGGAASYSWTIMNGSITSGQGTPSITFDPSGPSSLTLGVTVTELQGCNTSSSSIVQVFDPLSSVSISATGSTTVCLGGTGGTVTVTDTGGGSIGHQWGYRTTSGGAITDIAGQTGSSCLLAANDFPGAGGYFLVCTSTPQCGTLMVSNEVPVTISSSVAPSTPVISAALSVPVGATGVTASVQNNPGSTYNWTLTGGSNLSGQGTSQVTFDAGPAGTTMALQVFETDVSGCTSMPASALILVDFLDVSPSNPFHDFVVTLARDGVTGGCGGGNFCPTDPVLRSQMAVFLLRSEHGSAYSPPACAVPSFNDVPCSNPFASWIYQLVAEGVTGGCTANTFCPNSSVLRNSMAVFLLVTEHGAGYVPPACTPPGIFTDVPCPGAGFTDWIYQLVAEGITGGCTATAYCPTQAVSRAEMAVFLTVTFSLP